MERRLRGAIEFRTKAIPTIAHVARVWTGRSAASTWTRLTRQLFDRSCVKQAQEAARNLAPNEALGMLEKQWDELFHWCVHWNKCITRAIQLSAAPYVPGHRVPRATEADQVQMAEKLARRSSPKTPVKPPEAAQSGEARSPARIPLLDHELWLAKRLGQHGVEIFTGDTTPELRRKRFREAIKAAGFEMVIVGRTKDGAPETYQECLNRLYGEAP